MFGAKNKIKNPGGFIHHLFLHPESLRLLLVDGRWRFHPDSPDCLKEKALEAEAARKAANERDRLKRQSDAEEAYADMADSWNRLPESAKQEIRDHVSKESPLFHRSGSDSQEFELQCMREAFSLKRRAWRKKQLEERT